MKGFKYIAGVFGMLILLQPNVFADVRAVAGVEFEAPAGWNESQPTSMLRKFQFEVPGTSEDQNAELVVFYFGAGQGGDTDTNINRWAMQFSPLTSEYPPSRTDFSANGIDVTIVQLEGTYQSGMPGMAMEAKNDYAVVAAIVDAPQGLVFFKLMTPKSRVGELLPSFRTMLDGLKVS